MHVRVCKQCGKKYMARSEKSMYCCKVCRLEASLTRKKEVKPTRKNEQLCWTCARTDCSCLWMRYNIPIEGWVAKPTIVKDSEGEFSSFRIRKCPEYIVG